jgi:hypothetical protein
MTTAILRIKFVFSDLTAAAISDVIDSSKFATELQLSLKTVGSSGEGIQLI